MRTRIPPLENPYVLVVTEGLSREEWLEYRRQGIGGSDAPAVLGVSPFGTARDVYYDKLKIVSYEDPDENWVRKEMGNLLEDLVAQIFHVRTGYPIYKIKKMFYHPDYPFMLADIDFFTILPNGETAILEIKTTTQDALDKWWLGDKEIVPVNYEIQGRHYMAVMDVDHVFYCCFYGKDEYGAIIRHITRDECYEEELITLETDFWQERVMKKIPPPYVEDGELVLKSVKEHYGPADKNAPVIELSTLNVSGAMRYLELQAQKALLNEEVKRIDNEMKLLQGRIVDEMGKSCTALYNHDGMDYTITYNPVYKKGINKDDLFRLQMQHPDIYEQFVSESESRRFYVKKTPKKAA